MEPSRTSRPAIGSAESRFDELYRSCYRPVYSYCRRRVAYALVDDAVADTFMVAWRRIAEVPVGDDGLLWLYGVAHRVVANQSRSSLRRSRLHAKVQGQAEALEVAPDLQLVRKAEYEFILTALDRLGRKDREVLRLAVWEELSHAESAQVLDVSVGAVKQRLHRAKKQLARAYERISLIETAAPPASAQEGGGQ